MDLLSPFKLLKHFRPVCLLLFILSPAAFAAGDSNYVLGPGDAIKIQVYGEDDLSIDLVLDSSGSFDYPYLGQIFASGLSVTQLKETVHKGLKGDYLINPKVRVNVTAFRHIYVNGEVKKPGGYNYQPGLTVEKAIALAGGFTDRAAKGKIQVTSSTMSEKITKIATLDSSVKPGDIIVIDQSFF